MPTHLHVKDLSRERVRKSPIITDNIFFESDKVYMFRNDTNKPKSRAWRNSEQSNCSEYCTCWQSVLGFGC